MTAEFSQYFDYYTSQIYARRPMVMYRFGDGELMIANGEAVGTQTQAHQVDRWQAPAGISRLGYDLRNALSEQGPNIHFGIPCTCCNPPGNQHMKNLIKNSPIFPANIFINSNYPKFRNFIASLHNHPIAIWLNHRGSTNHLPFRPVAVRRAPDDCVNIYQSQRNELLAEARHFAKSMQNTIFLIGAGPLSEALIHTMWNQNPNNTYIDVGSALDEYIYMGRTRPYQTPGTIYSSLSCTI